MFEKPFNPLLASWAKEVEAFTAKRAGHAGQIYRLADVLPLVFAGEAAIGDLDVADFGFQANHRHPSTVGQLHGAGEAGHKSVFQL